MNSQEYGGASKRPDSCESSYKSNVFGLFLFTAAHPRSEATMQSINFNGTNFGISILGQGSINAVEGTHRVVLRDLVSAVVRRLSLCLASWRAFKRPMATPAMAMTPAATCLSYSDCRRHQRDQRWRVAQTRGTVGAC